MGYQGIMKNKSDLYNKSNPHIEKNFSNKRNFTVIIGTYERCRPIIIHTYTINSAAKEASDYCGRDEAVLEIKQGDKILWKHPLL